MIAIPTLLCLAKHVLPRIFIGFLCNIELNQNDHSEQLSLKIQYGSSLKLDLILKFSIFFIFNHKKVIKDEPEFN